MTKEEKAIKNKAWRTANKEVLASKKRAKYLSNRENILKKNAIYAKSHRETLLAYWRARNRRPDIRAKNKASFKKISELPPHKADHQREVRRKYAQLHSVKLRAYWRQYRKDHPEKTKAHNKANWHRRRALIEKATINLTSIKEFIRSVRANPSFVCYYCQNRFPIKRLHFDHIVALSSGGPHSVENLCTACVSCNESKQDKHVTAWIRIGQQVLSL